MTLSKERITPAVKGKLLKNLMTLEIEIILFKEYKILHAMLEEIYHLSQLQRVTYSKSRNCYVVMTTPAILFFFSRQGTTLG